MPLAASFQGSPDAPRAKHLTPQTVTGADAGDQKGLGASAPTAQAAMSFVVKRAQAADQNTAT
jgi:hypothetical protein